jgi:hypothetical protein
MMNMDLYGRSNIATGFTSSRAKVVLMATQKRLAPLFNGFCEADVS